MYNGALRSILSELLRQERLVVVDSVEVDAPRTKQLVEKLAALDLQDVLIVVEQLDENLLLASRNLYHVDVRDTDEIDPFSLVGFDKILMTTAALKKIEERLA